MGQLPHCMCTNTPTPTPTRTHTATQPHTHTHAHTHTHTPARVGHAYCIKRVLLILLDRRRLLAMDARRSGEREVLMKLVLLWGVTAPRLRGRRGRQKYGQSQRSGGSTESRSTWPAGVCAPSSPPLSVQMHPARITRCDLSRHAAWVSTSLSVCLRPSVCTLCLYACDTCSMRFTYAFDACSAPIIYDSFPAFHHSNHLGYIIHVFDACSAPLYMCLTHAARHYCSFHIHYHIDRENLNVL
jgi:hypothetical protein